MPILPEPPDHDDSHYPAEIPIAPGTGPGTAIDPHKQYLDTRREELEALQAQIAIEAQAAVTPEAKQQARDRKQRLAKAWALFRQLAKVE